MLLSCSSYYKQCCSKYWGICVFLIMVSSDSAFNSYGYIAGSRIAQHVIFPILCSVATYHFTFLPTGFKDISFSISSSMLVLFLFFSNNNSNRCEMISHCGLNLYFSDD